MKTRQALIAVDLSPEKLDMDGVISHRFPLDRVQEAFETCENKPADYIKGVVIP